MTVSPSSSQAVSASGRPRLLGIRLWPAVMVTLLTGAGFAGLKFVLINEIALAFDLQHPPTLPFAWMDVILHRCLVHGTVKEAITQGLAAVLTLGVLVGYAINAPLAGAWRCAWLFFLSCAGVAAGTVLTLWFNTWIMAWLVGVAYGAACAARGKIIPLLSAASGRPNTQVSGVINASLVIGLLAGAVFGTMLGEKVRLSSVAEATVVRHLALFAFAACATLLSLLVRTPEPPPIPFTTGMRELASGTITMLRRHWALLVGGGLAWGIASAASLAVYIDAIDPVRLNLPPSTAVLMAVIASLGAIIGNLASHYVSRRRHVMMALVGLGLCVAIYPHVVHHLWSAAAMMLCVGVLFAAPANVLDARLLALTGREGMAGRGSTVMSLVHNVLIFGIGSALAIPLFLGVMSATAQFNLLGLVALITAAVVSQARLRDVSAGASASLASGADTVMAAASTGIAE